MSCGFTGGKTSDKFFQYKKSQSTLFILGNRKWITFYIKDDNGKLWVEVIIVIFFYGIVTEDVIVVSNNDVNFIETQRIHFAWLNRSLFRFERINKVDLDFSQGQILSFVFPLKYHVYLPSILKRVQRWWVSWIIGLLTLCSAKKKMYKHILGRRPLWFNARLLSTIRAQFLSTRR